MTTALSQERIGEIAAIIAVELAHQCPGEYAQIASEWKAISETVEKMALPMVAVIVPALDGAIRDAVSDVLARRAGRGSE